MYVAWVNSFAKSCRPTAYRDGHENEYIHSRAHPAWCPSRFIVLVLSSRTELNRTDLQQVDPVIQLVHCWRALIGCSKTRTVGAQSVHYHHHRHGRVASEGRRRVASLYNHVHGQQHASRGLQSDGWSRFVASRATCSVDDQVGDATCGQEVGWVMYRKSNFVHFSERFVRVWNSLPPSTVNFSSLTTFRNSFKNQLQYIRNSSAFSAAYVS